MKTIRYTSRSNKECVINLDAIIHTTASEEFFLVYLSGHNVWLDLEKNADTICVISNYLQDNSLSK